MQIPPQEDWSPELLSELQRAVPVLESSSFELAGRGGRWSTPVPDESWESPSPRGGGGGGGDGGGASSGLALGAAGAGGQHGGEGGLTWENLAADANGSLTLRAGSSVDSAPTDMLSDDAMALPLSTLTSGKRRTYANRSTFQAHVCCVMDPLQVPRVLETLQANPGFQSSRSWPYAYRVISPFDRQTHEGCEDDGDAGAGEKMLGLLQRMGLENLLLIVCRWDSGPQDRLGVELFRCVSEQCKELLRELQRAVRASFPPEELLGGRRRDPPAIAADASERASGTGTEAFSLEDLLGSEGSDLDMLEDEAAYSSEPSGSVMAGCAEPPAARLLDLRALGPTPPAELVWATRGVCAPAPRHRPYQPAKLFQEDSIATCAPPPLAPRRPVPEPTIQRCTLAARRQSPRSTAAATFGCQDRRDGPQQKGNPLRLPKVPIPDKASSSPAKLNSARAMRSALV